MLIKIIKKHISRTLSLIIIARYRFSGIQIGKGVYISWKSYIDTAYGGLIEIGDGTFISRGAFIIAHDASVYVTGCRSDDGLGKIKIGENVFIGIGAIVFMGVTIGNNSVIKAGSVVFKDIPNNTIVSGNPAIIEGYIDNVR